ncbi:F-box only protein 16-like [Bubalus kerabau]|uniref:F-box only protein 16-like n=1 Tax=Bubalus carabanensis TaxID=3119969 RepID=UPI00244EF613|nr:F-box only protein 16-like [Bubalus carabanensis]
MMAFAPPKNTDGPKMQTKMSTWTPLNHQLLNDQFDKWTDTQRRRILTVLLECCSLSQQMFCCRKLQEKIPAEALDFTTKLPEVSMHWKNLTELNQLWILKCLQFNWYINVSPTPYEQGVWKKHYIQMVKELHVTKPKKLFMHFPGGSDGKESTCNAGDADLIPGLGGSPGEENDYLHQYSCLENPHSWRSLVGYSP